MIHKIRHILSICVLVAASGATGRVVAADHDDTNLLKAVPRHDARLTDLHVFTGSWARGNGKVQRTLVLAVSTNPTIPTTLASYLFPSDLTLSIRIDRSTPVDYDVDPAATQTYGGTIMDPAAIHPDLEFTVTFDADGRPHLAMSGLDEDTPIRLFAGLRDDPFIRGPRQGRNVASVVIELPLQVVADGRQHQNLLVWAKTSVPGLTGPMDDLGGRALRSQFAENMELNDLEPAEHYEVMDTVPDVVIFDTRRPAAFPNGRAFSDDVVDLVGDPRILSTDCVVPGDPLLCNPSVNDRPFLRAFPYLAEPQGAAAGNPGVVVEYPEPRR